MTKIALITSLTVSMIISSFVGGLVSIYLASVNLQYFPSYTLESLIKGYYLSPVGFQTIGLTVLLTCPTLYYMIATNED